MNAQDPSPIDKISFIAPSTRLPAKARPYLEILVRLLSRSLGVTDVHLSPYLFTSDELIKHVTASAEERTREFKAVIRKSDLIASVAGGTGAEDLALLAGGEATYRGSFWLANPPARKISGIPIGGNLTTFVNFLNRREPPRLNWRRHILFIEDLGIDLEDLHRLLAALRRHRVFREIKGLVIGSLSAEPNPRRARDFQAKALVFITAYLSEVMDRRKKWGRPLPILVAPDFGHKRFRNLPAIPLGGHVHITESKLMTFRLSKKPKT